MVLPVQPSHVTDTCASSVETTDMAWRLENPTTNFRF